MAENILVVDDDKFLQNLMQRLLRAEGYVVHMASTGEEGLSLFHQVAPDLVILDVMMPDMDGWEVCRRLRQVSPVPIIFLTALNSEQNLVDGLVKGGDDYLAKPFSAPELKARVAALLRRARMPLNQTQVLRFGDGELIINRGEQMVFANGEEVQLSPIEYNMLVFLAAHAGQILPAGVLYDAIWGTAADARLDSVKWYVWSLRQKLEADPKHPRFILTERGKGYRFSPQ
jgi:two-component system KDP operon response regulator KdpE